jgi:hypothetical protein
MHAYQIPPGDWPSRFECFEKLVNLFILNLTSSWRVIMREGVQSAEIYVRQVGSWKRV